MSDSLQTCGLYSPWNSPGQTTGVGSCSLLQGIFPTQGSSPGLPHCRRILYQLSHQSIIPYKFQEGDSTSHPEHRTASNTLLLWTTTHSPRAHQFPLSCLSTRQAFIFFPNHSYSYFQSNLFSINLVTSELPQALENTFVRALRHSAKMLFWLILIYSQFYSYYYTCATNEGYHIPETFYRFLKNFFMCTIFQVFIEFVTVLFLLYILAF